MCQQTRAPGGTACPRCGQTWQGLWQLCRCSVDNGESVNRNVRVSVAVCGAYDSAHFQGPRASHMGTSVALVYR